MPPAIIPAAIAIAASAAAAAGYVALAVALTIASVVASMALKPKTPGYGTFRDAAERKQVLRASAASRNIVYGRTVSSGVLIFAEEQAGDQVKGEWMHMVLALAGHPLHAVTKVMLADDAVGNYGNLVTYEIHNSRTDADPFLKENCPSWKEDMIGRGISFCRISLKFDAEKFPSGLPNIKFHKEGKEVFDPRDSLVKFTDNAALVILDYYRTVLNVPDSAIDMEQYKVAANICDEPVKSVDNSYSNRYTINGEFDLEEQPAKVLEDMCQACGGELSYIGGRHGLLVGAYYGPATMTLDESCIAGDIKIVPETSHKEKVNTINGTYIDVDQGFVETDFPEVSYDAWVTKDGKKLKQDFKFRFVNNPYTAQRLAHIVVNRKRLGRTMEVPVNFRGYKFRPGRYAKVSIASLGINNVEFRVVKWDFDPQSGITLTLREETQDMYGDAVGVVVESPPLTGLQPGGVAQPQNLHYDVEEIGQVIQGNLVWTNIGNIAYNRVIIRQNGQIVFSVQTPGNSCRLSGLLRGTYTAHVIAVSYLGAYSPEAYLEFSIQAPPPPSSVEIQNGFFAITLLPKLPAVINVSTQYDFWTSGETRLADASATTVEAHATRAGMGQSWTSQGLKNDHHYWWYVRTINAFGSSSFLEVDGHCVADSEGLMDFIGDAIQNTDLFKDLIESAVDGNQKVADMASAITENADKLAAAVGANKQTAESIIHNALAIANVVVSQSAQNGANSAKFEQLREVIATETEARVTDVRHLEAKIGENADGTAKNTADITEVRQVIATETEARATAVDKVSAATKVASDKADTADGKATTAGNKADAAGRVAAQNTADITILDQAVTTLDSATASRFEEVTAELADKTGQVGTIKGGVQNTAIALIQNTLAQVNLKQTITAQYGSSIAAIQRIDETTANDREANARSLLRLESKVNGNGASITGLSQTVANYQQSTATQVAAINASINGVSAGVTTNAQALANIDGTLNAMYSIKVAVDSNGRQYAAGMGIGVENTPAGMQSQILFLADRFAVMSQAGGAVTLPFVIENGQAFFNDAFFKNASIDFGKITNSLRSDGYQAGKAGWNIPKNGPAEFNDSLVINGSGNKIKVDGTGLDVNVPGVVRIHVGVW
ncbi:DUF1983 domain-containing protein [Buttiauxella sp. S04-F03]|uniref:phage tail protein n=1 Tax=Buttiauxella sp. W03-F01 TaxID=2904524 RepID=UPI001E35864E|nr:DUF1983 domain-containing protein [Buttiauxella sp. W03-F01]MCE0801975.1 DUF1983 domain-containing protein [Buttiauxella sp. W03-F01]